MSLEDKVTNIAKKLEAPLLGIWGIGTILIQEVLPEYTTIGPELRMFGDYCGNFGYPILLGKLFGKKGVIAGTAAMIGIEAWDNPPLHCANVWDIPAGIIGGAQAYFIDKFDKKHLKGYYNPRKMKNRIRSKFNEKKDLAQITRILKTKNKAKTLKMAWKHAVKNMDEFQKKEYNPGQMVNIYREQEKKEFKKLDFFMKRGYKIGYIHDFSGKTVKHTITTPNKKKIGVDYRDMKIEKEFLPETGRHILF